MRVKMTRAQAAAFQIYVADVAHSEDPFLQVAANARLGDSLHFEEEEREAVWEGIVQAANSADAEIPHVSDPKAAAGMAEALSNLARKVICG